MSARIKSQVVSSFIIVVLLIQLIFISSIIAIADSSNESSISGSRARDYEDVRLYFHFDNKMDTIANESSLARNTLLNDGESHYFDLDPVLQSDLAVERVDFEILLRISNFLNPSSSDDAEITIKVLDGSTVIASNSEIKIPGQQSATLYSIPFIDSSTGDYVFKKGHKISVNISASISGTAPVSLRYETGKNDAYMEVNCLPISKIIVAAHHDDDTLGAFYPNLPYANQRIIIFKGSVTNKFGSYDVNYVEITCPGIFNGRLQANYTSTSDSADGYFEMQIEYDSGLTSPEYTITAYAGYNSERKEASEINSLSMSDYGVYLECLNNTGIGYPEEILSFTITVFNIGGRDDSITLETDLSLTSWSTNFPSGKTTSIINAGGITPKEIEVIVGSNAEKNDECIVDVTGISVSDSNEYYDLDPPISVVAEPPFNFIFRLNSPSEQNVSKGESVTYPLTLRNTGGEQDTYTVTGESGTSDWEAVLTSNDQQVKKEADNEFIVALNVGEDVDFLYTITAPSSPTVNEITLDVEATAENVTEPSKRTIKHTTVTSVTSNPPPGVVTIKSSQTTKSIKHDDELDEGSSVDVVFELKLENEDLFNDFDVELDLINLPDGWDESFESDNFELSAGVRQDIDLVIEVPEIEFAASYSFEAIVKYDSEESSIDLTVIIEEYYDVELDAIETEKTVTVGDSVEYDISITNKGNVEDAKIKITMNNLVGWEVTIDRPLVTLGDYDTVTSVKIIVKPIKPEGDDKKGIIDVQAEVDDTGEEIGNRITLKTFAEEVASEQLLDFVTNYWIVIVMVIIIIIFTFYIRSRLR